MIDKLESNYSVSLDNIFTEVQKELTGLPWSEPEFYAEWLAQTFYMVSHTPRFICLAAARFCPEKDFYHRKMVSHFSDEDEHEYLLIDNLKALGFEIENYDELPESSLIVQQLYYLIDRVDPISIFGRILFLEMMAAQFDDSFIKTMKNQYSKDQISFLQVHFEEDVEHVKKAFSILDSLEVEKKKIIGDSFYMTGYLYKNFLQGILREYNAKKRRVKSA